MTDFDLDTQFEQRLASQLVEFADAAVKPFDAAQITQQAVADATRRAPRWSLDALLPRSWRPLLLVALLALGLVAAGIVGGYIKLPNNFIAPNPSYQPFSPLPTLATLSASADASASPLDTPFATPTPITPASPILTGPPLASPTPEPSATTAPTVTPTPTSTPTPTTTPTPTPSPTPTPAISVVAIAQGDLSSCALASDGRVFCWGTNDMGQLGDGTYDDRYTADVPVTGIDDAIAISSGIRFSCALRADRTVWCWGEDPGSDGSSAIPFQVPGIDDATEITAGGAFACALRLGGAIGCWGNGQAGQLGNGVYENNSGVPSPQAVVGIDNAVAVSAGWAHACALLADGTVECWGANGNGANVYGSLGDGTNDVRRSTPAPVVGLDNVVDVQAGGWTTCARQTGGRTWCWGYGEHGLGNGQLADSNVPVDTGIDDALQLAVGGYSACATRADDSVWCWGDTFWDNSGGQAGSPVEGNKTQPAVVSALVVNRFVLLIDGHGRVWLWGRGFGETPQLLPVGP